MKTLLITLTLLGATSTSVMADNDAYIIKSGYNEEYLSTNGGGRNTLVRANVPVRSLISNTELFRLRKIADKTDTYHMQSIHDNGYLRRSGNYNLVTSHSEYSKTDERMQWVISSLNGHTTIINVSNNRFLKTSDDNDKVRANISNPSNDKILWSIETYE